jgi:hypothetical protein
MVNHILEQNKDVQHALVFGLGGHIFGFFTLGVCVIVSIDPHCGRFLVLIVLRLRFGLLGNKLETIVGHKIGNKNVVGLGIGIDRRSTTVED